MKRRRKREKGMKGAVERGAGIMSCGVVKGEAAGGGI